jgi:L-lactate dehydrogenase complex protein LldE
LRALSAAEVVVIPSGSCGAMLRVFYPELFASQPEESAAREMAGKTFEFSEFLVDRLGVADVGARFPATVAFHDGCHGLRELRIRSQPRTLLSHVKDLKLVEMQESQTCCGFGGSFAAKFASVSTAMGRAKLSLAESTGATHIVSNDASCLMHLQGLLDRQSKPMRTIHLAEVLAGEL